MLPPFPIKSPPISPMAPSFIMTSANWLSSLSLLQLNDKMAVENIVRTISIENSLFIKINYIALCFSFNYSYNVFFLTIITVIGWIFLLGIFLVALETKSSYC